MVIKKVFSDVKVFEMKSDVTRQSILFFNI